MKSLQPHSTPISYPIRHSKGIILLQDCLKLANSSLYMTEPVCSHFDTAFETRRLHESQQNLELLRTSFVYEPMNVDTLIPPKKKWNTWKTWLPVRSRQFLGEWDSQQLLFRIIDMIDIGTSYGTGYDCAKAHYMGLARRVHYSVQRTYFLKTCKTNNVHILWHSSPLCQHVLSYRPR